MGQIRGKKAHISACNIRSLSSFGIPYAGMHILVSTDNSATADGQGNFNAYVVGDGVTAATELPLRSDDYIENISSQFSGSTSYWLDADSQSDTYNTEISANGDTAWCVSDFVPVNAGDSISFIANLGTGDATKLNKAGAIFYDSDKQPIEGLPIATNSTWTTGKTTIVAPENASYVKVTYYGRVTSYTITRIILLKDKLNALENEFNQTLYASINNDSFASSAGWIRYSDGSIQSSSNMEYYQIPLYDKYKSISAVLSSIDNNSAAIAFYSTDSISTEGYIKDESIVLVSGTNVSYEKEIPSGAKLMVITNRKVLANASFSILFSAVPEVLDTLDSDSETDALSAKQGKNIKQAIAVDDISYHPDSFDWKTNACRLLFTKFKAGEKISFTPKNGAKVGMFFSDANFGNRPYDSGYKTDYFEFTIPNDNSYLNCRYMVLSLWQISGSNLSPNNIDSYIDYKIEYSENIEIGRNVDFVNTCLMDTRKSIFLQYITAYVDGQSRFIFPNIVSGETVTVTPKNGGKYFVCVTSFAPSENSRIINSSYIAEQSTFVVPKMDCPYKYQLLVTAKNGDTPITNPGDIVNYVDIEITLPDDAKSALPSLSLISSDFSIGGFSYTANSKNVSFTTSNYSIVNKEGIILYKGDVVSLRDYDNAKLSVVGFSRDGGEVQYDGNLVTDYVVPFTGSFIFSVVDKNNTAQSDTSALFELLEIKTIRNRGSLFDKVSSTSNSGGVNYSSAIRGINHRGYNVAAPENTIPAFIESRKHGFAYAECDVCFSSDDVPVVIHDNTIDRTSNGTGNVNELSYQELRTYDFGSWYSPKYAGTKIPSLEELLYLCRNIGLHLYIELKQNVTWSQQYADIIVNLVNKCQMKEYVTYISFSLSALQYIKNVAPEARLGYVVNNVSSSVVNSALGLKTDSNEVFIDSNTYTANEINLCKDANVPLEIWTINTMNTMLSLNDYICGVTSDSLNFQEVKYNQYVS